MNIADQAKEYGEKLTNTLGVLVPPDLKDLFKSMLAMAWVEGNKAGSEDTANIFRGTK